MFPYRFRKGRQAGCLGVGADGMGLLKPQTNPLADGFMRAGYLVRGTLAPTAPGFYKTAQQFTAVDLRGTGSALQGQFALSRLSKMNDS
jgi:hypothetical protein